MTITCPWCGTSYTAFQTNCSNCGGTLPAPPKVQPAEVKRGKIELQMPPAPPREISDGYAWRIMLQDGWVISGGIFALLGFIFAITGAGLTIGIITAFVGLPFLGMGLLFLGGGFATLYWRYQQAMHLVNVLRHGESIQGEISGLDANYNVRINGRHPWTIHYKFENGGQQYEGKVGTLNEPGFHLQPGNPAVILYLPDSPEHNSLYPHP